MENIGLFNEKLNNDINRLKLSEGIMLDPTKFALSLENYKDALQKVNSEFFEKRELLLEIADIMQELTKTIQENEKMILESIEISENKGNKKEKIVYENALNDLSNINKKYEKIAIFGNIDNLF